MAVTERTAPNRKIPGTGDEPAQRQPSAATADVRPRGALSLRANFSWTFVGNAVNAGAWWAMTVVLAQLGSPEHVGQFALGLAVTAPVFMFATLRLRDIQATDAKREYRFGHYFALRLTTTALALLVVAGIVLVSHYPREVALVILATALSKAIEAISDAYYGLFMQRERLDRIAKSMMIKGPLSLVGLAVGYALTGSVFWGVIGLALARAVIMVAYDTRNAAASLGPNQPAGDRLPVDAPRPHWDVRALARLAWMALPLGIVTMLISFNANIPRYVIEGHLGAYQLGIFAAVAALQKSAPTVIQALGRSASPRMAKYYAAGNAKAFRKLALRLVGIGTLLGGGGVLVAAVAGRPILTLFYGPDYALPGLLVLLMLAAGIDYVATMLLFVITSARYFRVQLPLQALTTGTVALASFWLIPSMGLQGAALALILGDSVRVVGTLVAAWHAQRALHRHAAGTQAGAPDAGGHADVVQAPLDAQPRLAPRVGMVDRLVEALHRDEIVYCHWKSTIGLAEATAGMTDLDLLVDRNHLQRAEAILASLGYRAAIPRWGEHPPGIEHYYGLDPETGRLVHVHLFSRVLTGESYVKSHLLPFEAMLLKDADHAGRIRVPSRPAELVLFVLRAFIKLGSPLDLASLWRKPGSLSEEARWLLDGGNLPQALSLLGAHCPVIEEQLFSACLEALVDDAPLTRRLALALKVRRRLAVYAKHTPPQRALAYGRMLAAEARRRLAGPRGGKVLRGGGAVIAIVGADATGKSTLVAETARWLGDALAVRTVHAGKPPSSWLTAPVNLALSLARRLTQRRHDEHPAAVASGDPNPVRHAFTGVASLPYALRAVVLACDRRRLILRARRWAAQGEIVICDRYPSRTVGAMDSPRLEECAGSGRAAAVYNRLARLEARLYRQIPPPDIGLRLRVSLETAIQRNRAREGREREEYLASRHHQSRESTIAGARYAFDIHTEGPIEATIRRVKEVIWEVL